MRIAGALCFAANACACVASTQLAAPDLQADALFSRPVSWRGGDSAYSVALGPERVLWLFGDSWVGDGPAHSRSGRRMTRNTVGLQTGSNPRSAEIAFYGEPFFDDGDGDENTWLWPGPAVLLAGHLLIFLVEVRAAGAGTWGFQVQGSRALWVEDPAARPDTWVLHRLAAPVRPAGVEMLGAALTEGGFLYLFSVVEPGSHDVHLGRVPLAEAARGELTGSEWFDGRTFGRPAASRAILPGNQTEFSVHREAGGPLWLVSTNRFAAADIVAQTASLPEGPWSAPKLLFHPASGDEAHVFVYSAKAHPELGAPLHITYCTNHEDFWQMAARQDLYFPRFLTLP